MAVKQIEIHTTRNSSSTVMVGEKLGNLARYLPTEKAILLVDENVERIYGERLGSYPRLTVPCGEANKTLSTVEQLASQLLEMNVDRNTFLVGIGGGITCDIAGFVSSIFMRGLKFGFVSTTLLSQLDASIGGKNGVNLQGYKNMLGMFNQPDFVICDPTLLTTLPESEFRAGLSELVKAALIADATLFNRIAECKQAILSKDQSILAELIGQGIEIKAAIVRQDECEAGERRMLNLGHTFAHAIEKHGSLNHGEAVSVGLVIAANISQKLGLLSSEEVQKIEVLLSSFGLPTKTAIPKEQLLDAILKDKKKQDDGVHYILMNGIGNAEVKKLSFTQLAQLL